MTAPVRLTDRAAEVLAEHEREVGYRDLRVHCRCGWTGERLSGDVAHRDHVVVALAAAALLPEATTVTEWGVRSTLADGAHTGGPWPTDKAAQESADRLRSIWRSGGAPEDLIASIRFVRRQRTRYADHVGPWEEAPSPQTSTDRKAQR